jgi:hypothetical protein
MTVTNLSAEAASELTNHEKASIRRYSELQAAIDKIPIDSSDGPSLANLSSRLDAQLKLEEYIVKFRAANHPKLALWAAPILTSGVVSAVISAVVASLKH